MIAVADIAALGFGLEPDEELLQIRRVMRETSGYNAVRVVAPSSGLGALGIDDALRGAVRSATFRSNLTPPVTWDPSAPRTPSSGGGVDLAAVDRFLQPTLEIDLVTGQRITIAPAGPASSDYRVVVGGVVIAVVGSFAAAVLLGYWLGRRARRRAR